jgi:hypothetical protein
VLDGITRASRDWAANGNLSSWLTHGGERLRAAELLLARQDLAAKLEPTDKNYVAACQRAERTRAAVQQEVQAAANLARQARKRARHALGLVGALAACVIAVAGLGSSGFLDPSYLNSRVRFYRDIYLPTALTAEQERALKPGDKFQECASCPEMVVVPAGEFMMGSEASDVEKPPHKVIIGKPFAIGRFSVTFDEWDGCIAHGGCTYRPSDDGFGRGRRPVINMSWIDINYYLAWLSSETGKTYRLLTEAEWRYGAQHPGWQGAFFSPRVILVPVVLGRSGYGVPCQRKFIWIWPRSNNRHRSLLASRQAVVLILRHPRHAPDL